MSQKLKRALELIEHVEALQSESRGKLQELKRSLIMNEEKHRTIAWTPDRFERLKHAYQRAVAHDADEFELKLQGDTDMITLQFVTGYAKYLILHLENEFRKTR